MRRRRRWALLAPLAAALALAVMTPGAAGATLSERMAAWKNVNYYPSKYSWDQMWTRFNPARMDAEFIKIRDTFHANVVRINLQTSAFGYPTPRAVQLDKLARVIQMADARGLKVQLTLFDWFESWEDVAGSKAWATAVLAPYRDDPRIAYIDLHNEVNLRPAFRTTTLEWARQLSPHVQSLVGDIPVTISVLNSAADARFLKDAGVGVDFYDLHFYALPYLAEATFREARDAVAPAPLFVGEFGYSTYPANTFIPGVPATRTAQEAMQAHVFRTIARAAQSLALPIGTAWTFIDFDPATGPVRLTEEPREAFYGLLRANGTLKPGGATIASLFQGQVFDASFNNGFEANVSGPAGEGLPAEWRIANPASGTFRRDTSVRRSGLASARIGGTRATAGSAPAFYMSPVQSIAPGQPYRLTAWAKGTDATGETTIALSWFDRDFGWLGQHESSLLPAGTTPWTQLVVEATAPPGAAFVEMWLKSAENTGRVNFDDVVFARDGAAPVPAVHADQRFDGTLVDSWGGAGSPGGAWTTSGPRADFDVAGGRGTMALTSAGANRWAVLSDVSVADTDLSFAFSTSKAAVGGSQYVYGLLRRVSATTEYRAKVRLAPNGAVFVQAAATVGNVETPLGAEVRVPGLVHVAGGLIHVRVVATGRSPTTIRMRAWASGSAEPSTWSYGASDAAPALQAAGAVGLRAYLGASSTNAPVVASFDHLRAVAAAAP